MNPFPLAWATLNRNKLTSLLFIAIVALAVALGVAISAQERALRQGTARAADRFDLIVAAPGSLTDLLFSAVYLRPAAVELLPPAVTAELLAEPAAEFTAPIGFGDSIEGAPVVGTTAAFVEHLSQGLAEGVGFAAVDEAVVGALSPHRVGDELHVQHGGEDADALADVLETGEHGDHEHEHAGSEGHMDLHVVGRLKPTGTPWDRAIITPIEYNWVAHGLGTGHAEGETRIGPPFDAAQLPGVPAVIVKPADVAAAYGLRGKYRTASSTAFFPAEVLTSLYEVMGNVATIMSAMTLAMQVLVIAAILAGIVAILDLMRQRFAVLRALGASRLFVFATLWSYVAGLLVAGAAIGLGLGYGLAAAVSGYVSEYSGVAINAAIGVPELVLVGVMLGLGLLLATLPALLLYRQPVIEALRA